MRVELTTDVLPRLAEILDGVTDELVVVLPLPEAVPGSFRNATPPPGQPALLDSVRPLQRVLAEAKKRSIAVTLVGFPRGLLDGGVPDPPVTAMIEVTSRCNLRCPLCSVGRNALSRKGDLSKEAFTRLVGELGGVKRLALHNLGEPLLHRELPELVRIAKEAGIPSVFLSTNLAVDDPQRVERLAHSGVDEIVASLDAADQATYPIYRVGGRFEVVLRNLEVLTSARRTAARGPKVRLQFLLFRHNFADRDAFRALARRFGVGYEMKVASAPKGEESWLPDDPSLRRTEREADHGWCTRPSQHTTVLSDGTVVPCCKDADGAHALGNVHTQSFSEIWGGLPYQDFRRRLREDKASIRLCSRCPGGWFLGSNVVEREEDPWVS